ncbi:hypothetical protein VTJ04DRAFT_7919 [Mycothermus thermophilus]|uniref:uncharacterized protein n=1 Tax=Humicola insolens TaxID=85995 RepID=UPI0037428104
MVLRGVLLDETAAENCTRQGASTSARTGLAGLARNGRGDLAFCPRLECLASNGASFSFSGVPPAHFGSSFIVTSVSNPSVIGLALICRFPRSRLRLFRVLFLGLRPRIETSTTNLEPQLPFLSSQDRSVRRRQRLSRPPASQRLPVA